MSNPAGPSLLDEFFTSSGSASPASPPEGAEPPPRQASRALAPPSRRSSAPPPPPSLRGSMPPPPTLHSAQASDKSSRSLPPPPPSKRRAIVADPLSEGDVALDEERDLDVDVSLSDDAAEAKPAEAAPELVAAVAEPAAVAPAEPIPESAAARIRSMQPTVPGLSPLDAVDRGWDAVAAQIPAVEEDPPAAPALNEAGADTDRQPSPSRASIDVPTPIVPIDFDGITREATIDIRPVSPTDADVQTVVRAETPVTAPAEVAESDDDVERPLTQVSTEDGDEQTVVRLDPPTTPQPSDEALTSPFAAPPPDAIAAPPPPRVAIGSRLRSVPPPPPSRASAKPTAHASSLPPPPSFDKASSSAPAPRPSRPMPLPPRPSMPPPARAASEQGPEERVSLDALATPAPSLAPPSFAALSAPPPPPPPPPKPESRRPAVPPPSPVDKRPLSVPVPLPAMAKIGPTENTPTTIQVSTITGQSNPADFTPTVQVQRASARPLPPPARVPTFSGVPQRAHAGTEPIRPKSSSIAPLVDSIPPPAGQTGSRRLILALAALTLGVAVFFGLRMRPGSVVVTVSSESGSAVKEVVVKIDDVVRCNSTPCEVSGLEPGAHLVTASAAGLAQGAQRAFSVAPGGRAAEHMSLGKAERVRAELSVAGVGDGLHVFVDGRDLGAPPIAIHDIEPDTHVVRVTGPGRLYEPYEETVRLEAGEARSLGPVRLKLLRGKLELLPGDGSDGAKITVDGRRIPRLPMTIELAADESHEVTAQRKGFADFSEEIVFDNAAHRSLEVSLSPGAGSSAPAPRTRGSRTTGSSSVARSAAPVASAGGMATLDVVSTPSARVVINGRPMGSTPLRNVRVPAGPQTVVFVHSSLGRKIASTAVAPGGHGSVGVKF